jgi:iron complex outermembrane recepter protein
MYNDAINNFYPNPNKTQFDLKQDFRPGTSPFTGNPLVNNQNYFDYRINPFKNLILSAPSNFTLSKDLKFDTIPYMWYGFGNGGGIFNANAPGTAPNTITPFNWGNINIQGAAGPYYNPSITETYRPGVINKFTYTTGNHQIVAGHWFEYADHTQTGSFTRLNADGSVSNPFGDTNNVSIPATATCRVGGTLNTATGVTNGPIVPCPTGPIQRRDVTTTTTTNMFFVGDTWKFAPGWSTDFGVKHVIVEREVRDRMPGAPKAVNTLEDTATLPTVGLKYKWNDENQLFASVGTSFRLRWDTATKAHFLRRLSQVFTVNTRTSNRIPASPTPAPACQSPRKLTLAG